MAEPAAAGAAAVPVIAETAQPEQHEPKQGELRESNDAPYAPLQQGHQAHPQDEDVNMAEPAAAAAAVRVIAVVPLTVVPRYSVLNVNSSGEDEPVVKPHRPKSSKSKTVELPQEQPVGIPQAKSKAKKQRPAKDKEEEDSREKAILAGRLTAEVSRRPSFLSSPATPVSNPYSQCKLISHMGADGRPHSPHNDF
jgi:hypothetical protein